MAFAWLPMELTQPAFLAGLAALPVLVYCYFRSLVDLPRWQRLLSLACRATIVVLLVLALAGLTLLERTRQQFVIFALDRSLSVDGKARDQAERYIERCLAARGDNRVAYLYFAARSGKVQVDDARHPPGPNEIDDKGTNLAEAIEVAAGGIPPSYVAHIVLLTDGNQTEGDAVKAAAKAGIPVSTVPLPTRTEPDVQLSALHLPDQVRDGEPFKIEVVVDSNHDDEGIIELYRGPHRVGMSKVKVHKGENRFSFKDSLRQARQALYAARIRGFRQDQLLDNNAAMGLVFSTGKPRVLLVDSEPRQAIPLRDALQAEGIEVEVRPPRGMPNRLDDLQNFELLILANVPAASNVPGMALNQRQMEMVRTYVSDLGGGLLMLGGNQSFGLGGYYKTVLEDVLPVRSDFEKEKESPGLAMVLIIDKSGSMGENQKMELAKEAAKNAVALLGPKDQIGVIAFDSQTHTVSELGPCTNKDQVCDRIARIEADGGTIMYPPLEQAFESLKTAVAKYRHVILLTDGIAEQDADFQGLAATMAAARITVSTVAVGPDADKNLLEQIAKAGNGRYYFTDDPSSVPQIFAKETVTASKSALKEEPFTPQVLRRTRVLGGIDLAAAPPLLGHVQTRAKLTAEWVLATERNDPLLVWWRYGLGMSVAFTSDAKALWAAEWLSWPGYSRFWAQVVRHAMRKNEGTGIEVKLVRRGRRVSVTVDAVDPAGRYLNHAETRLTVIDPNLDKLDLPMKQTAPGRYAGEFETPGPGIYHLELSQQLRGKTLYRQSRGLVVGYPEEYRIRPTNEKLLHEVAGISGGSYNPTPEAVFAPPDRTARRAMALWPFLVKAAALLFLVDVALRRIDLVLLLDRLRRKLAVALPPRKA